MINFRFIRHLWLFQAVAEEQHFGRAAARLGMSQPPLTEQIQALEQALGVKLFERSRRGTRLSPAGAAILPEVSKLGDYLARIELAVREAARGQQGLFTIGAVTAVMTDVLPGLVAQLRRSHPGVTVSLKEINTADAVPALRAGEIDLALTRLEGETAADIASVRLQDERLAIALPAQHRLAGRSRIRLSHLAEEDFVMFFRHTSPGYFDALVNACTSAGFSPRIVHEVGSVSSQLAFAACGQGVALVPASFRRVAPAGVAVRTLADKVQVVTASAAWSLKRQHPLVEEAVRLAGQARSKHR